MDDRRSEGNSTETATIDRLEEEVRAWRLGAVVLALGIAILLLSGWIQEREAQGTAEELRTRSVVLVDEETGREVTLAIEGSSLMIRGPFGTTELAPGPALILREGEVEVLRLGGPAARPLH